MAYPSSYQNTGEHGAFHQMGGSERRREMERGGDPRRRMDERSVNYGRDIRIEVRGVFRGNNANWFLSMFVFDIFI